MIEFTFLGILLMVPLAYLILTMARLESASYAVIAASRDAGRAYATAASTDQAEIRALTAARLALANHGLQLRPGQLRIDCSADPCLTPGGWVEARLVVSVRLPLVPAAFSKQGRSSVRVNAGHAELVDEHIQAPDARPHNGHQ
jgi:hypothetical protein